MENNTVDLTKRTKGKWKLFEETNSFYKWFTIAISEDEDVIANMPTHIEIKRPLKNYIVNEEVKANAAFICEAVNSYDHLNSQIDELAADNNKLIFEMESERLKLKEHNSNLLEALKRAKNAIIDLTDSDQKANKIHYPKYIDDAIQKAEQ